MKTDGVVRAGYFVSHNCSLQLSSCTLQAISESLIRCLHVFTCLSVLAISRINTKSPLCTAVYSNVVHFVIKVLI